MLLTRKLLKQGFLLVRLKSSLRQLYGQNHDLVDHYGISVSQMTTDMFHLWQTLPGVIWYFHPHGIFTPGSIFIWYFDPEVNFFSLYFEPPYGKLTPLISTKKEGFIIPQESVWNTMGRGVKIPWVGGRYTMKGGSHYHG